MHADRWLEFRKTPVRPGNYFLRALDDDAFEALRPHLEILNVPNGYIFGPSERSSEYLYFPISCVLNVYGELADGSTAETKVVSRFGFLGATALVGVRRNWGVITAIHGGQIARVRSAVAAPILRRCRNVVDEMLRYVVFTMHLLSLSLVCQRHHSLEQRLARWLSLMRVQTGVDTLDVTHDQLGRLLGVRREGISETMKTFECARLVTSTRGHLHIVDPLRLRQRACACIDEARAAHTRFFPRRSIELTVAAGLAPLREPTEQRYAQAG